MDAMGSGLEWCLVLVVQQLEGTRYNLNLRYLRHISYLDQNQSVCEVEREGGGREGFGRIKDDVWGVMEARERLSGGSGVMENKG